MSKHVIDDNRSPLYNCLNIAVPAMLESLLITLLSMFDTWMVAGLGPAAVASVGLTNQPKLLVMTVFFAIATACSAICARRGGEDDNRSLNETLVNALAIGTVLYIVSVIICVFFSKNIMVLCGAEADTLEKSSIYFAITMGGLIFTTTPLIISACLKGIGLTKITLITTVISNLVNIFFNYLLIGGHFGFPALGVRGAAIATVIGYAAGCLASIAVLFRKSQTISIHYILSEKIGLSFASCKSIFNVASNLFLENLAMRIGLMLTAIITAHLGTGPFASHQVGMLYLNLAFAIGDGLQTTSISLIGYSLGQHDTGKAKRYIRLCIKVGLAISAVMSVCSLLFGKQLFMLYFTEENLVEFGIVISRYFAVIVLLQVVQLVCSGSLRGAGDVRFMMISSLICVTVIQPITSWFFAFKMSMGLSGIWLQILLIQFLRLACTAGRLLTGKWEQKKV